MSKVNLSGDYTRAGLYFQVKKTLRYIRLYGFARTFVKIKGQFHMRAATDFHENRWVNPACTSPDATRRVVAIIGAGNYAFSNIAYYLYKQNPKFLRCVYSPGKKRAVSLCRAYGGAYVPSDWVEILSDEQVKIVFIASSDASHAEYAIACIEAGKHVHIEKPHVVSEAQLARLLAAMKKNPASKVFLGFNRPRSPLFRRLQEMLSKEAGTVMVNWFIGVHEHDQNSNEAMVMGHLCHWTDLTLHLISIEKAFPCTIVPSATTNTKSDFVLAITFADQSCAALTFSAKGHIFDGLREVLNLHKGNLLANLADFHFLNVDVFGKKTKTNLFYRDHGHEANIINSLASTTDNQLEGEHWQYVSATAHLFLAAFEAIESGRPVTLSRERAIGTLVG